MMRNIFWILLLLPLISFSQVQDDFTDGNFINPLWSGDTTSFLFNNGQLQSNGPNVVNSKIYLSTNTTLINNTEWQFLIDLKFNPTSTTNVKVYLVSDASNLLNPLNGYFIQLGQTNDDSIKFYKKTGITNALLFTGSGSLGGGNIKVRIKVTRDNLGNWAILSDKTGGTSYISEGNSFLDNTFTSTSFFGITCEYSTASRYNLYYFDDFSISQIVPDIIPPSVSTVSVLSQNLIDVLFSENVDLATSQTLTNYTVNNSIGYPAAALRDGSNNALVHLSFTNSFITGQTDSLFVHNIQDLSGNPIIADTAVFTYYAPVSFLADSFSDGNFNLNPVWIGDDSLFTCIQSNNNYQLRLNATLPKTAILHTPFAMQDSVEWRFFIHLNFSPSSATYARVFLTSDNTNITGSLNGYFLQFGEANNTDIIRLYKKMGTVETEICHGTTNISAPFSLNIRVQKSATGAWKLYTAAENSNTYLLEASGSDNSITTGSYFGLLAKFSSTTYNDDFYFDDIYAGPIIPDTEPPVIISAVPTSQDSLDVLFSENLSLATAQTMTNYFANNSLGIPVSAQLDTVNKSLVHLVFSTPFPDGARDTLWVYNVADIHGNAIDTAIGTFRYFIVPNSFSDNFQDANFTLNPIWIGDDSLYTCILSGTNYRLRSNGTIPKTAILYTHVAMQDSMEWRFNINLNFSPSSTSKARVYLAADSPDFDNCNGYFLQFGETGDTDKVSLFRQDLGATVELCRGTTNIANTFNLNIRVTKEADGTWKLFIAQGGSSFYILEGVGFDNSITATSYFGVYSKYSSVSYKDKFFYDNFYSGPIIPDTDPPVIMSVTPVNINTLDVLFSEDVRLAECTNVLNYFVTGGIDTPITAEQDVVNHSLVHLNFLHPFVDGNIDTLSVFNMTDNAGNIAATMTATFRYFIVLDSLSDNFNDGDFTANPIWIGDDSLYTCTQINSNFKLRLNASIPKTAILYTHLSMRDSMEWHFKINLNLSPSSTSNARIYLASDSVAFVENCNAYFLQFGESNATDVIRLIKQTGVDTVVICSGITNISTAFSLNVKVTKEADGTWKIFTAPESNNLYVLECVGFDNTMINSRYFAVVSKFSIASYKDKFFYDDFYAGRILPDITPAEVLSVTAVSQNTLDVLFSEDVDLTTCTQLANYSVTNGIGSPATAEQDVVNHGLVHLTFSDSFVDGRTDTLSIFNMKDNNNNISETMRVPFRYFAVPNSFTDNFTDGNFITNPIWLGDDSLFICDPSSGNTELMLNATVPKTAVLYTHLKGVADTMEWHFDVNVFIYPSSTSLVKVYLAADKADFKSDLVGYYLQLGESNATDVIRLFRQNGADVTEICIGTTSIADPFNLKIKVLKIGNTWTIYSASIASSSYNIEGTGTDSYIMNTSYFGVLCKFSSVSYQNAYSFDNFYAGPIIPDTVKPTILNVTISSFNAIDVTFSEPVQLMSAQDTLNYKLDGSIGFAHSAIRDAGNMQLVHLTFNSNLVGGSNYQLTVFNVNDFAGNSTDTATFNIFYSQSPTVINEHFNDGDFYDNPTWIGRITDFMVTPELQLELFTSTEIYDTSYLATSVNITEDSCEWQFYTKVNISPSASNFERFYLVSDNSNLAGSLHGYYIQIGENGSNDALVLTKQNGTVTTPLFRGTNGVVAVNPSVRVKVTKNFNTGEWKLYADPTGNTNFQNQGSFIDSTYNNNLFYIGPYMRYSSSNATEKFFFDDIYAGKVIEDTIAPSLVNVVLVDSLHLDLQFSENLDLASGSNVLNYFINKNIGNPLTAILQLSNYSLVHLTFATPVLVDTIYTVTISNIKDTKGNQIASPISHYFSFHKIKAFDIVINEIMADPSPVVLLPEIEYLELYNRTHVDIDLTDWKITIGSSMDSFPQCKIAADSFLIVVQTGKENLFQSYGRTVGLDFSSSILSNAGTSLVLSNEDGMSISSVTYSDSWYHDNLKKNGGWSLEQIDPMNPCNGENNWKASTDSKGGTPGKKNSVYASNPDLIDPILVHAVILSTNDSVRIFFNEPLTIETLTLSMFSVDNNIGYPIGMSVVAPENTSIKLKFAQAFQEGIVYTITVTSLIFDCAGNPVSNDNSCKFGISQLPAANDIVINEVLFNPLTDGVDYIEVYNRSSKIIDFADLRVAMRNTTSFQLENADVIAVEGYLAFPASYYVFTSNPDIVKQQYTAENQKNFIKMIAMPSLNSTSGEIVLIDKSLLVIDDFAYNEKMQFALLTSFKGVALERVNFDRPTSDNSNWHSAAQTVGYGTPTYKNSQYQDILSVTDEILISPEIFSPDEDGYNDVLSIGYRFNEPGYNASITVYDARGRLTKKLVNNELLGTTGLFTWTGLDENNNKAEIGIYLLYIEVFDLQGNIKKFKKTCVLASKLK